MTSNLAPPHRHAVGPAPNDPGNLQTQVMIEHGGGRGIALMSAVALVFSGYSLWETSLKQPDVHVFVPQVLSYASPYHNDNFEMIGIPLTLTNEGARTATILQLDLSVYDPRTKMTKRFYGAAFGSWTMEKTRAGAYEPFAPISLAGRSSRSDNVLFYTRGPAEKPDEMIHETGSYVFTLTLVQAEEQDWFSRLFRRGRVSITFERDLPFYDARVFNHGTIPLYSKEWRAAVKTGKQAVETGKEAVETGKAESKGEGKEEGKAEGGGEARP